MISKAARALLPLALIGFLELNKSRLYDWAEGIRGRF